MGRTHTAGQIQQHGGCVKPADGSRWWWWWWWWWSTTAIISIWSECNPGPSVSISRSFVTSGRDRIKMKIICRPWRGVSSRYTSHNFDDIQHSLHCGLVQGGNFQKSTNDKLLPGISREKLTKNFFLLNRHEEKWTMTFWPPALFHCAAA